MVTRIGSLSITHSPIFQWQVQICASLVSFPLLPPMVAYKEIRWLWRREWQELFTTSSKHSFPLSFKSSPCWCSPCILLSEVIFNTLRFCKGRLRAALIIKAFFFSTLFCEMDNYKMDPLFFPSNFLVKIYSTYLHIFLWLRLNGQMLLISVLCLLPDSAGLNHTDCCKAFDT